MDQIKIGKFISEKRKEAKLTQSELAEKLNITDRAISKWENGKSMPDAGIIPELCKILNITITDLFSGEIVDMKDNKKIEENILDAIKQKEISDKKLLDLEILLGISVTTFFVIMVLSISFFIEYQKIAESVGVILIIMSTIFIFVFALILLKIEQVAGYYECKKCKHKYVPTFNEVLWAPHVNRTRYLKCPKCGERSMNKKVVSKSEISD